MVSTPQDRATGQYVPYGEEPGTLHGSTTGHVHVAGDAADGVRGGGGGVPVADVGTDQLPDADPRLTGKGSAWGKDGAR